MELGYNKTFYSKCQEVVYELKELSSLKGFSLIKQSTYFLRKCLHMLNNFSILPLAKPHIKVGTLPEWHIFL